MSKLYFFMNSDPAPQPTKTILPDVYCPVGGYLDKNLGVPFESKGHKARWMKARKLKEAELYNPNKMIGGTEGANIKQRGQRGNFRTRPMPAWMKQELSRHVG